MTFVTLRPAPVIPEHLALGQSVRVINTHGQQVVDAWPVSTANSAEFMSMEPSRAAVRKATPVVGESYQTNCRRSILTVTAGTSPGVHDTLVASCDPKRCHGLGYIGHHDNCTENLHAALGVCGPVTPCPENLFMNIAVLVGNRLEWCPLRRSELCRHHQYRGP